MMEFQGKNVLIFGFRRSGRAAAEALRRAGAVVSITDKSSGAALGAESFFSANPDIKLHLGGHPVSAVEAADIIVVSPGVPPGVPALARAGALGKPIIGEVELGYRLIKAANPSVEFYAVTGTNGKSTTATLLYHMLKNSGRADVLLAGNIGTPLTGEFERARTASGVVLELSSFQLESIEMFSPNVAAILNLAPDHLDRYGNVESYYQAKLNITRAQEPGDFLILNAADPATMDLYREKIEPRPHPRIFFFGRQKLYGAYLEGDKIFIDIPGLRAELISASEILIKGAHNLENAMAAALMALLAGARVEAVAGTLRQFPGLEHRMEFVREIRGVSYINDSKGTNPPATLRSIESFAGKNPVILIAGGRDKGMDFGVLRDAVSRSVKKAVLIGEAREKIKKALGGTVDIAFADTLAEAVRQASGAARSGDVVLLSPSCASFDMFADFEDRGRKFKQEVARL